MDKHLQERAYWLLLVFMSGLSVRVVNDILLLWCKQLGRTLQDFFMASTQEWSETCQLNTATIQKLTQAQDKFPRQIVLVEQLQHSPIQMLTILDPAYPLLLKFTLNRSHLPPILFVLGDLSLLQRHTIAIIGSRNADEVSLAFTRSIARSLAEYSINIISGNARGVDRAAYEETILHHGYMTVALPHGIRQTSKVQMRDLLPGIETGKVLLLSQFHPDATWLVSRAMARNNVMTGLAQTVIVAEANTKGGTWEGANCALQQGRPLYVRYTESADLCPGNQLLIDKGGRQLLWPCEDLAQTLSPLIEESVIFHRQLMLAAPASQFSQIIGKEWTAQ